MKCPYCGYEHGYSIEESAQICGKEENSIVLVTLSLWNVIILIRL